MLAGDELTVWDVTDGRPVTRITSGVDLHTMALDDRGTAALVYPIEGEKPRLRIVDLADGTVRTDVALPLRNVNLVQAPVWTEHAGRRVLVVNDDEGGFVLYDPDTGDQLPVLFGEHRVEGFAPWFSAGVLAARRVGDRHLLATGSSLGSEVRVWDAGTGEPLARMSCAGLGVSALAFGDDDGRPVLATATRTYPRLQLWDAVTGTEWCKGVDMSQRVNPMEATALQVTRWRGKVAVLAVGNGWPPFLWAAGQDGQD